MPDSAETTPEGQAVANKMRRSIWQRKLGKKVLNVETEGQFSQGIESLPDNEVNNLMVLLEPRQQADAVRAVQRSNNIRDAARQAQEAKTESERQHAIRILRQKQTQSEAKEIQDKQGLLVSLLSKDPAKLVENVRTIEGINRTWKALDKIPGGKQTKAALAKFETYDMLDFLKEGYIRTGRVPYKDLKIQMQNKDFRAKLKALNGENFVNQIDTLVDVTNKLSDSYLDLKIKFKDDPSTLSSMINIMSALGVMHGDIGITAALLTVGGKNLGLKGLNKVENMWNNKSNYDQARIKEAVEAAKAVESGNRDLIRKRALNFAPISTNNLKKR